ncbi:hypothetical protein TVAG_100270 [Trichomonas vaginalis G3]|uniref:Uncharacterized protein n=1 Tax=Trichomonas vaginalis (strain ATCC PRA-98 / G3) TaxID=412133 RepID=A2G7Q7_TRIV3|nr:hypothetical protein TVAGG3_0494150 [Trichomonas vaginalis G3]EAX86805.1 hypothetical protein TVAG_100270 [Trichomonas vaginalis G3]KAI5516594.1 hypothetical protein TVAGG3_0494150 [Trichomonas vaginalis G3]|eukprot:XP_001299735.1 hypothetical protein [Trichomonas vaginalis G3]
MTTVFNPSGEEAKAAFPTLKPRPAAQRLSTNLSQSEQIFPPTKSNYVVGNFNVTNYVNRVVELAIVRYKTSPQYESQKANNAFGINEGQKEAFPSRSQNTEAFPSRSQKQEQPTEAFPSRSQNTEAFPSRAAKKEEPATEASPSRSQNTEAFPSRSQNTEAFPTRSQKQEQPTEAFPSRAAKKEEPATESFPSRTQKQEQTTESYHATRNPKPRRAAKEEAAFEAIIKIPSGRAAKEEAMFEASPPSKGKHQIHTFIQETVVSQPEIHQQRKNSKTFPSLQPLKTEPQSIPSPTKNHQPQEAFPTPKKEAFPTSKKEAFTPEPIQTNFNQPTEPFPTKSQPKQEQQQQQQQQAPEPFPTKTEAFPSRTQKTEAFPTKTAKPDTLDFVFVKSYVNGIISRCLTKANAAKNEQLFAFPKRNSVSKKEPEPAQTQQQQTQQQPAQPKTTQELANEYAKKAIDSGLEKYKNTKVDDTFAFPTRTKKPPLSASASESVCQISPESSAEQLSAFPSRSQKTEAFPSRSQTTSNSSEQNQTEAFPSRSQKTEAFPSRSQPKPSAINTQPQEEEKSAFPSRSSPRKPQPQSIIQDDEDDEHGFRPFPTHQMRHHSPGARPAKMTEDLPPAINVMLPSVDQDDVPQSALPARPQLTGEDSSPSKRPIFNPILTRKPPMMPSRSERNSSAAREGPPMADKLKRSASTGSQNILLRKDLRAHFEKTDSSELKQAMERKDIK